MQHCLNKSRCVLMKHHIEGDLLVLLLVEKFDLREEHCATLLVVMRARYVLIERFVRVAFRLAQWTECRLE